MDGNGSYKLALTASFPQGLINSFWKLQQFSFALCIVSFIFFHPQLFFLCIHFNVAPHLKTSSDFFSFSLKLWLKNEHQGCRPFIKFFRALISTDLAKQTHRYRVLQRSGWRSLQKCLHMDSKQGLNFWSKSVWKGFIYSCLNNFSDTLLHTILCPVPYISSITVHLLWCVHQLISFPLVLHGAYLFDFQVFLRKPVVTCT